MTSQEQPTTTRICSNPNCPKLDCDIPYGQCHCGCTGLTRIPKRNELRKGHQRGVPLLRINGHGRVSRRPPVSMEPFEYLGDLCMRIPLTHGMYAIVDCADFEWLSKRNWTVSDEDSLYAVRTVKTPGRICKKKKIYMHKDILGKKVSTGNRGDHWNGDTLDNRRNNLRPATKSQNAYNSKRNVRNTSGFKCVVWCKWNQKWRVRVGFEKKRIHIGYFETKELAYAAYCEAARRLHGEFARLA